MGPSAKQDMTRWADMVDESDVEDSPSHETPVRVSAKRWADCGSSGDESEILPQQPRKSWASVAAAAAAAEPNQEEWTMVGKKTKAPKPAGVAMNRSAALDRTVDVAKPEREGKRHADRERQRKTGSGGGGRNTGRQPKADEQKAGSRAPGVAGQGRRESRQEPAGPGKGSRMADSRLKW